MHHKNSEVKVQVNHKITDFLNAPMTSKIIEIMFYVTMENSQKEAILRWGMLC